jgi:hypothetical protein
MRAVVFAGVLLATPGAWAQDEVLVYGTIKDHATMDTLTSAQVVIASERGVRDTVRQDGKGGYEFYLPYDRLWQLRYEAPGRVTKLIAIDTRRVPAGDREGGHGMNIDMKLFPALLGKDYTLLKEPMSIARYVDSIANFGWDLEMAERMRTRIDSLLGDSSMAVAPVAVPVVRPAASPGADKLKWLLGGTIGLVILGFGIRALRGRSNDGLN